LAVGAAKIGMQVTVTVKVKGKLLLGGRLYFARMVERTPCSRGGGSAVLDHYDTAYEKNALRDLVTESFKLLGGNSTPQSDARAKDEGFKLSTTSGITIGIDDIAIRARQKRSSPKPSQVRRVWTPLIGLSPI